MLCLINNLQGQVTDRWGSLINPHNSQVLYCINFDDLKIKILTIDEPMSSLLRWISIIFGFINLHSFG